jgi:RNA polymerase sigma factor (sigma-70 family)
MHKERKQFEAAVEAERGPMLRQLRGQVDVETAQDLVQDAMLIAVSTDAWREIICVKSWMWGVVKKVAWGHRRKRKETVSLDELIGKIGEDASVTRLALAWPDDTLERMEEDEEFAVRVGEVLELAKAADLSRKEYYVVVARLRGQEYKEIAQVMAISENAVRTYLSLALAKIRGVKADASFTGSVLT